MKPLVLVGAGGHAVAAAEVAIRAGREIAGLLTREAGEESNLPWPVLGDDGWLDGPMAPDHDFLVAVGMTDCGPLRARLYAALIDRGLPVATIVSPDATISPTAELLPGTIVMHRAVIGAGARIGANVIVNTAAVIEHGAVVGDHAHVSTGALVNGECAVGPGGLVGSGAILLQGVRLAANVALGAGAVAVRDLMQPGVYVGVPARRIR